MRSRCRNPREALVLLAVSRVCFSSVAFGWDRQTDRPTDRPTKKETNRHTTRCRCARWDLRRSLPCPRTSSKARSREASGLAHRERCAFRAALHCCKRAPRERSQPARWQTRAARSRATQHPSSAARAHVGARALRQASYRHPRRRLLRLVAGAAALEVSAAKCLRFRCAMPETRRLLPRHPL